MASLGILLFRFVRTVGKLWLPDAIKYRLSEIGFYENTVRVLNPDLPQISVRSVLGLTEVWPDHAILRHGDGDVGSVSRPQVTATP